MNIAILMGRLTAAPEIKTTTSGKKVARFGLAVDRRGKDAGVDFLNIVVWEKLAEFAEKYLRKGMKVVVNGRIQARQYEKDGQKRTITEITASNIEFAESKKADSGNEFGKESAEEIPF